MGRYGVLCSGSIVPAGQLINATPRAANLYARPLLAQAIAPACYAIYAHRSARPVRRWNRPKIRGI